MKPELWIPVTLYYDDFNPGNTLGSHSGEQQLGGIYLVLPFLPPHLVAKLDNILLAGLFYTKHRKNYGNSVIFSKVIENLKEVRNGITVKDGHLEKKYIFN